MSNADKHFYEFGSFRLDPARRLLLHEGELVPLQLKAFETLLALLERHGQVVSKEELMQRVWPNTFVEEINLTKNISVLRKTLANGNGAGATQADYIVTVPRQGYRFAAEVREISGDLHSEMSFQIAAAGAQNLTGEVERKVAPGRRWRLAASVVAVLLVFELVLAGYLLRGRLRANKQPVAGKTTLAVLPFHTLSAPEELRFLGLALPDAISARLASIRQLRLIPMTAVLRYENQHPAPQQIGQALASDYLLSGTVLSAAENVQVSVELIRVLDGARLWGEQYDLPRPELHRLQYSITEQISATLKLQLTGIERQRFYRRYTANAAAYDLYLRGRARTAHAAAKTI